MTEKDNGEEVTQAVPDHWSLERMINHAQSADRIADNCRPDNPHFSDFRKAAFDTRRQARGKQ